MNHQTLPLAGLLLVALSGCGGMGFEEFYEVSKLRTLALISEPPELGPGQTAVFSTVTVNPSSSEPIAMSWEACLVTDGPDAYYTCSEVEGLGVAGVPLGNGAEVQLSYDSLTAAGFDIGSICASLAEVEVPDFVQLPNCDRGLPITIRHVATQAGVEEVAIRTIVLLNPEEAAREDVNLNPDIGELLVDDVPAGSVPVSLQALADREEDRNRVVLSIDVDLSTAQTYAAPDPDAAGERLPEEREVLEMAWFTTHGEFKYSTTYYAEGVTPDEELGSNELRLTSGVEPAPGDVVQVWAVLRDDRGGVNWRTWQFTVVE